MLASGETRERREDPRQFPRTTPADVPGVPQPRLCVWEITLRCDLGCKHCGSRAGPVRPNELSTAECLDVVAQLAEAGFREVALIGGEAYLREDWDIIAAEITRRGMHCSMVTGARQLDAERVARAVAAGVRRISISIDGLEATHDAQRGVPGSWAAAVAAARRVSATSIRLGLNTQINRLSLPELPAIADLLAEVGADGWQTHLTVAMGRAADRPELLLQPYDLLSLFPLLVWIKQTKLTPRGIGFFPGNNIGYFGPYEPLIRYGGLEGATWSGCGAGNSSIGLEADGKIKGCPSLPSGPYTGGNLRTQRLADVIRAAPQLRHLRERTREDLWGFCRTCEHGDRCLAGCSWTAHCLLGKPGNNPYCIHRALDFEARGLRERVAKAAPAPGEPFDHGRFEIIEEPLAAEAAADAAVLGWSLDEVQALGLSDASASDPAHRRRLLTRH